MLTASMRVPRISHRRLRRARSCQGLVARLSRALRMESTNPVASAAQAKSPAQATMSMTTALEVPASTKSRGSFSRERVLYTKKPTKSPQKTPTAAASVGVNTPP